MARPRKKVTNITRILEALSKQEQTSKELQQNLKLPEGTVRSTLSFLTRAGLTEFAERAQKPFCITEEGKKRLEEMQQETA
jgi:predicted transcriptional regulator